MVAFHLNLKRAAAVFAIRGELLQLNRRIDCQQKLGSAIRALNFRLLFHSQIQRLEVAPPGSGTNGINCF